MTGNHYLHLRLFLSISLLFCCLLQVKASGDSTAFVLKNVVIHTGKGNLIPNGFVLVQNGKISEYGEAANQKSGLKLPIIDGKGKHLYPGFILLNTPLGLSEIDAVRATQDHTETGDINPNARVKMAYNAESELIPTLRQNGILTAQVSPRGNGLRGLSSIVQLDARNWEEAVLKEDDALHLEWPSRYQSSGWWAEPGSIEKGKEVENARQKIKQWFADAALYQPKTSTLNPRLAALRQVLDGKSKLYIHARFAADILSGLEFCRELSLKNVVLVTGSAVTEVLDAVKSSGFPVVLTRIHSLPLRNEDPVQFPAEIPATLWKAGILFSLDYSGDMEIMGARSLPFLAGSATRAGMSMEEALKLLTSNPARILGMDKQLGAIDIGLDATFFLCDGNALEIAGNNIQRAWIQGKENDLKTRQIQLYEKFKPKSGAGQ
jgi:imidazolonepropionase-like amidohydrolase